MGGGELIPLSGMGAEFFDNIGALVQVSYFEDGTYVAASDGEEVGGDWWVDGQMLYSVDASGYTEAEWSHFEEGVIQTVTTYWEDASGAQQDVSDLPEFFLVRM